MFQNIYSGKKVLVTGHTGFKGSWLSKWLLELGAEVAGLSLYVPSNPSHYEILKLANDINDYEGDIRDLKKAESIIGEFKPDVLFHLAAQPIVSSAIENPVDTYTTNIIGTTNMLEAIRNTPSLQAAVFITSDKCYENVEWEYGYRERDQLGGKDPYSASKAGAEIVFSSYFRTYFKDTPKQFLATARAGNVIGGGDWAKDRLIPDCMTHWADKKQLEIRSTSATRPWQHVLEPLSGYLTLGMELIKKNNNIAGEAFNFGPDASMNLSVGDIAEHVSTYCDGFQWYSKAKKGITGKEAMLLRLNCDKALTYLKWLPTLGIDQTINNTLSWYKDFYEGKDAVEKTISQIKEYVAIAKERERSWTT